MGVRFGVIGLGMMGRHHVRVLSSLDGVELVGVHDPEGDPHHAAPDVAHASSIDEMLEWGLDAAVVAAPTDDHLSVGLRLAEARISALIEKPLAIDVAAGQRLVEAFRNANLTLAVGHVERFNPAVRSMKRRILDGEIGELFQISSSRQGPFPDRIRDVGVIKDLATHDIDLTGWVAESTYVQIAAQTAHRAGRPHEDLVAITGRLADGTVVNHLVNWLSPSKQRRITVVGSKGCLMADTLTADLTYFANGKVASEWDAISKFRGVAEGDIVRYAIAKPEPLVMELTGFRNQVAYGDGEIVTGAEGLRTLRVAEAAVRSAVNGTVEVLS